MEELRAGGVASLPKTMQAHIELGCKPRCSDPGTQAFNQYPKQIPQIFPEFLLSEEIRSF